MPTVTVVAPPPPVKAKATVTIRTTADTNPDDNGRPSPVVVRLYQLRADGAFRDADFGALSRQDQTALGQDLLRRTDYTLTPGSRRQVEFELPEQAGALCAVAEFQRLDQAVWRACLPLPAEVIVVTVESNRIVLAPEEL
jgi:type VI secretion system protein VasD